jgi:hypothetical protein
MDKEINNIHKVSEQFFTNVLEERLVQTKNILGVKAKEYVRNGDRLHNFNVASITNKETREKALWGMATKHLVSIMDIVEDTKSGKLPKEETVDEKIGDMINYLVLLEVSLKQNIRLEIMLKKQHNNLVHNLGILSVPDYKNWRKNFQ